MRRTTCLLSSVAAAFAFGQAAQAQSFFTNGVAPRLADPTVIFQEINGDGGYYYGTGGGAYKETNPDAVGPTGNYTIYRSKSLSSLFDSGDTIIVPIHVTPIKAGHGGTATSPILFYYNQRMYLSYKDVQGKMTQVAYSTTPDPTSYWANDTSANLPGWRWSLLQRRKSTGELTGELYAFYVTSHKIHAVKMTDPITPIAGTDQVITQAVDPASQTLTGDQMTRYYRIWEHEANVNPPGAQEGPAPFAVANLAGVTTTWLAYSANSYTSDAYQMGLLRFTGGDTDSLNDPAFWTKDQHPFFKGPGQGSGDNFAVSVGANAFVQDRAGQLWNVYTGRFHSSWTNGRELRMDPVVLDAKGEPQRRQPGPSAEGQLIPLPQGDPAPARLFQTESGETQHTFTHSEDGVYYSAVSSTATAPDNPYNADQNAPWTFQEGRPSYKWTNAPYAFILLQFVGKSIAFNGPTGAGFGTASIYQDGKFSKVVDFGSAVSSGPAFVSNYTDDAQHTLLVMVQADNPADPKPLASNQPNHKVGLGSFTISHVDQAGGS